MEGSNRPPINSTPQDPNRMDYSVTGQAKVPGFAPNGPNNSGYGAAPLNHLSNSSNRMQTAGSINGYMSQGQIPPATYTGTTGPGNNFRQPTPSVLMQPPPQAPMNGSNGLHNYPLPPTLGPRPNAPATLPNLLPRAPSQVSLPRGGAPSLSSLPPGSSNQGLTPNYDPGNSRPNELPVPFHGQGQYSHQVNPLMQKTPIQTPGNSEPPSEKSSRGPSPISGSTIDALEGQFTPGHGAPSPQFPLNRGSPLSGSPGPSTPPSGTPPRVGQPQPPLGSSTGPLRMTAPHQPTEPQPRGPLQQGPPMLGTHTGQQQPRFGPPPPMSVPSVPRGFAPAPPMGALPGSNQQPPPVRGNAPHQFSWTSQPSSSQEIAPPPVLSKQGFPPGPVSNTPVFAATSTPSNTFATSSVAGFPPSSGIPAPVSSISGFPPTSNTPRFPPSSSAPRFPQVPSAPGLPQASGPIPTMPRFPPAPAPVAAGGFPPPSGQTAPGFPPAPSNAHRYPPPPTSAYSGYPRPPGVIGGNNPAPPPTSSYLPPPPVSNAGGGILPFGSNTSGLPPPPTGHSGFPPTSQGMGPSPPGVPYGSMPPSSTHGTPNKYPTPQYMQQATQQMAPGLYSNNMNNITQSMGQMEVQDSQRSINLLNERHLISPEGVETAKPTLPHDYKKVNCSPDIFRCTLNAIPQTSSLLNKARLPLGIIIHPFKDLSQLPVIQSSVIVRCRSCRTYINPFVVFVDQRRWKCNLCFRVNELPDEFSFDPVTKTYGDPQRRPEVKSATIEFIAPSEYTLRPPQPAVYLYLLDVSFNAVETGYLSQFCQILLDELDKLPGDARTTIGFLCYDKSLYYFNLAEGLSQPQMLVVPDLEDPFLPCPDNLLVYLHESKELVIELLNQLPTLFEGNHETGSALGAALQAAHKLMSPTGGRITVMQTCLPTIGPGALENREVGGDSGKNVAHIGPATDFYKKLSLDCSAQQIAVDLFMLNGQYADLASLSCISKYSAGCVYYYPSFHTVRNPGMVDKFETDLRRYLTRKIGFESVMRIRCTRGLSIHTFHGNFFVRSTDLLSLPNINPDAGFGMQMSIEDNLQDSSTISFQAALLYTSSKGERRIRVHTLCVPVTNQLSEIFAGADQQAIAALLAKMAVDRSLNSAISDARDAMMNASLDALGAYAQQIPSSQRNSSTILAPYSLRLMPLYMLAMLKSVAFSLAGSSKLDTRVFAMQQCKVLPLCYLVQMLHPHLYPLHKLSDENPIKRGKEEIPSAGVLQLSSANIERTGLFLMDTGEAMYLLVGSAVGDQVCHDVFDKPNFASLPDGMMDLPELDNPMSERIRSFVNYLMDSRPNGVVFLVIRDDSKHRHLFFQHMLEDRTENSMSYYEFLQFLQGKAKG
ncbi:SEC24 family, member A [Elysia marginata]|uniref:SEC24 family, member A n=1 Tax=Elysia marginata TaxID=1093978 RepID=A0AAV4HMI7_9GAST|nr:SEC24 family, member A [Elysia marginata]